MNSRPTVREADTLLPLSRPHTALLVHLYVISRSGLSSAHLGAVRENETDEICTDEPAESLCVSVSLPVYVCLCLCLSPLIMPEHNNEHRRIGDVSTDILPCTVTRNIWFGMMTCKLFGCFH